MGDEPEIPDWAPTIDCWQCGGEGLLSNCWDDVSCIDPEFGCEICWVNCDVCNGRGGWPDPAYASSDGDDLRAQKDGR